MIPGGSSENVARQPQGFDVAATAPFTRRTAHRHHRRRRTRSGERLLQLPQASVQNYARWVEEKPNRTEAEQKFLWKYQRCHLIQQDKLSTETLKDYVLRLMEKTERTPAENRLIFQYQRRRAAKKARKRDIPQTITWKRNRRNLAAEGSSTSALASNMATLRESMDKLGLSSHKLRDANMES
eukprot:scaffold5156_cov143-Cylindrotheca_fusiformis.AAC.6